MNKEESSTEDIEDSISETGSKSEEKVALSEYEKLKMSISDLLQILITLKRDLRKKETVLGMLRLLTL